MKITRAESNSRCVHLAALGAWMLGAAACAPVVLDYGPVPSDAGAGDPPIVLPGSPSPTDGTVETGQAFDVGAMTGSDGASVPAHADASVAAVKCFKMAAPGIFTDGTPGALVTKKLDELSCEPSGAGDAGTSSVYMRPDGGLLMRAGVRHSLRWKKELVSNLLIYAGSSACDAHLLFEEETASLDPWGVLFGSTLSCRDVTPKGNITYLRGAITPPDVLEVCEAPCTAE